MEDAAWDEDIFSSLKTETVFDGYENESVDAEIIALASNGELKDSVGVGDSVTVVLDRTAFYAESGGQVGDSGVILNDGCEILITDTKKLNGRFLHFGTVKKGSAKVGDKVTAKIDSVRRAAIKRNHSAAHLLQAALKKVLGNHIAQAGSYVSEDRVRFDFSHFTAMTAEELAQVERDVNEHILAAMPVETMVKSIDEAKKMGATALFGEKYGETVRVVKMGDYSMEFCGGTHVSNTGNIGLLKITSESGVAAGVRRIEGVTGFGVLEHMAAAENLISDISDTVKSNSSEVLKKVAAVTEENKSLKRELESLKSKMANSSLAELTNSAEEVNGIKVIAARLDDGIDMNALRNAGDNLKQKLDCAVIVLASAADGKVNIIAMATPEAIKKGAHAGNIIREVAKTCGGGGGGKPDSAQAGGKDASRLMDALALVKTLIK